MQLGRRRQGTIAAKGFGEVKKTINSSGFGLWRDCDHVAIITAQ